MKNNSYDKSRDLKSRVGLTPEGSSQVPSSETEPLLSPSNSNSNNNDNNIDRRAISDQTQNKLFSGGEVPPLGPILRRAPSPPGPSLPMATTMDATSITSGDSSSRHQPQEQQLHPPASQMPSLLHYQQLLPHDRSNSQHTIPSLHTGKPYSSCDDLSSSLSYDVTASANSLAYNSSNRSANSNRSYSQQRYSPSQLQQRNSSSQQQNARAYYVYQQRLLERQHYYNNRATLMLLASSGGNAAAAQQLQAIMEDESLLEVPEDIYAVRRAALTVYRPLTRVWLVFTVGFSTTLVLGMSCWMHIIPVFFPLWVIFLPVWLSHAGLLACHIHSIKALSHFINNANENRQRPDTTDHLDRTEYLPLLQRSLKFALKAGFISLCGFTLEILLYLKVSSSSHETGTGDTSTYGNLSLTVVLAPVWIIALAGLLDGLLCKTQHWIRVLCWLLLFSSMIMAVLKVDYHCRTLSWRLILLPLVAILLLSGVAIVYIVYGHQIGYFRLTESQLTAGVLYAMSILICTVLLVVMGEIAPLQPHVEFETRLFIAVLAPLVMSLVGVGAWAVSKDEFRRLQLQGGQTLVHPMRLRFENQGWTAVEGRGVAVIPMFGEVRYEPIDASKVDIIELCICCQCYPFDEEDEAVASEGPIPQTGYRYMNNSSVISRTSSASISNRSLSSTSRTTRSHPND